jgi:hypothetical protein
VSVSVVWEVELIVLVDRLGMSEFGLCCVDFGC